MFDPTLFTKLMGLHEFGSLHNFLYSFLVMALDTALISLYLLRMI